MGRGQLLGRDGEGVARPGLRSASVPATRRRVNRRRDRSSSRASSQPGPATRRPGRQPRAQPAVGGDDQQRRSPGGEAARPRRRARRPRCPRARTTRTPSGAGTSRARPSTTATTAVAAQRRAVRARARSRPASAASRASSRAGGAGAVAPPAVGARPDHVGHVHQQHRHRRPLASSPVHPFARPGDAAFAHGPARASTGRTTAGGPTRTSPHRRRPTMAGTDHTARATTRSSSTAVTDAPTGAIGDPRDRARRRRRPARPLRRHQVGRGLLRLAVGQRPGRPPDRAARPRPGSRSGWPRASTPPTRRPSRPRRSGIGGGIAVLVVLFLAYLAGGYVAGRMSRFDGARQGLAVWVIGLLVVLRAGRGRRDPRRPVQRAPAARTCRASRSTRAPRPPPGSSRWSRSCWSRCSAPCSAASSASASTARSTAPASTSERPRPRAARCPGPRRAGCLPTAPTLRHVPEHPPALQLRAAGDGRRDPAPPRCSTSARSAGRRSRRGPTPRRSTGRSPRWPRPPPGCSTRW